MSVATTSFPTPTSSSKNLLSQHLSGVLVAANANMPRTTKRIPNVPVFQDVPRFRPPMEHILVGVAYLDLLMKSFEVVAETDVHSVLHRMLILYEQKS